MSGGGFAGKQPCACQDKGASANRHGQVCGFCRLANPVEHCWTAAVLRRDDDDLRRGRVVKGVVWDDFHPAAGLNSVSRFRHSIKAEGVVHAARNVNSLKDFPRAAEVDDHRAFRKYKGHADAAVSRRRQRASAAVLIRAELVWYWSAQNMRNSCIRKCNRYRTSKAQQSRLLNCFPSVHFLHLSF